MDLTVFRRILSQALAVPMLLGLAGSAHAAPLLYIFDFSPDVSPSFDFGSATITFSIDDFAKEGDTLTYVSGDVNGCAPATAIVNADGFGTPPLDVTQCGDGTGPNADGFFFGPDVMPPLTVGFFTSTATAGRALANGSGGAQYFYTSGRLTIRDAAVPEPASLALLGLGLAGLGARQWRTRRSSSAESALDE